MEKPGKNKKPALAKNIIRRRRALAWSALKLSEKAEMPYPTLRDIEAGVSGGRPENLRKIAKALGCKVSDLRAGEDSDIVSAPIPEVSSAADLLSKFSGLSPNLQKVVLAIVYKDPSYAADLPKSFGELGRSLGPLLKAQE